MTAIEQPPLEKRTLARATRLNLVMGELPPGDKRETLVAEIKSLVEDVNDILARRDGISMWDSKTRKKFGEQRIEELSEEYAGKMVILEERNAELQALEKSLTLHEPRRKA